MNKTIVTMITWNRLSLTQETINSLFKHSGKCELLVVDNGSTDGTIQWLRENGHEVLENGENLGIFMATRRAWFEAYNRGYKYILNLQNDFPCIRPVPFSDIENFLDDNKDVGFVQLNDKSKLLVARGDGSFKVKKRDRTQNYLTKKPLKYSDWIRVGDTEFAKSNHHFSFNPNLFRSYLVDRLVGQTDKPRERYIMEQFENAKLKASKVKKICFETIIRKREDNWTH